MNDIMQNAPDDQKVSDPGQVDKYSLIVGQDSKTHRYMGKNRNVSTRALKDYSEQTLSRLSSPTANRGGV